MGAVLVIVLVIAVIAALGFFGFLLLGGAERKQRKAEANAAQILDTAFDGRPDVSVNVSMVGLKYDTYVIGAKQRGYRILSDGRTNGYGPVIFEKA